MRLQCRRHRFQPWVGKIPWRRKLQPTPVIMPAKSHGQRSLAGYSPWSHKKVRDDLATKQTFHTQKVSTYIIKMTSIRHLSSHHCITNRGRTLSMCPCINYLLITSKESRSFNLELYLGLLKTLSHFIWGLHGLEKNLVIYPIPNHQWRVWLKLTSCVAVGYSTLQTQSLA